MSELVTKGSTVAAFIVLVVICALVALGIGIMNSGGIQTGAVPGVLLFAFGAYVILGLGPDGPAEHDA